MMIQDAREAYFPAVQLVKRIAARSRGDAPSPVPATVATSITKACRTAAHQTQFFSKQHPFVETPMWPKSLVAASTVTKENDIVERPRLSSQTASTGAYLMTKSDLTEQMEREGIRADMLCSINAVLSECFVIRERGGIWETFYAERGLETGLCAHPSEDAACRALLGEMQGYAAASRHHQK